MTLYDPEWSATAPMAHQITAVLASLPRREFALFMEQGTGKTKVALDKTVAWFREEAIDGLVVFAPNGVHRNWIAEEIPKHLPANLPLIAVAWRAGMGKKATAEFMRVMSPVPNTLRVCAINIEALSTPKGCDIARRFLASGRMHAVVDESQTIKTPSVKRTRNAIKLGRMAALRTIATGTEITEGPLDLYSQFEFLRPGYLGPTYTAFKHHYAEWVERQLSGQNGMPGRKFPELVRYRNLDELIGKVNAMAFRITKAECLDLPPKVPERRPVELSSEQMDAYRRLVKSTLAEFSATERISAPHMITRLLRLQQIVGGFIQLDNEGAVRPLPNAKLVALLESFEGTRRDVKTIIWARFVPELNAIARALAENYGADSVARYWGEVSNKERARSLVAFQGEEKDAEWLRANGMERMPPPARFFVGQQQAGGKGLTLHAASKVEYFSNNFSWSDRIQSEDRAHRIGQTKSVTYTDWIAEGTIDEKILRALREKKDMAQMFKTVREILE